MENKNYLILDDEFIQYCKLNNIEDINKLAKETFARGFTILKYGESPRVELPNKEKIIEKWKEIGLLDKVIGLATGEKTEIFEPKPNQIINDPTIIPLAVRVVKQIEEMKKKDKKDLYDE